MTPFGLHEGILGLLVHIPVLIGISLLTEPQKEEHVISFMEGR